MAALGRVPRPRGAGGAGPGGGGAQVRTNKQIGIVLAIILSNLQFSDLFVLNLNKIWEYSTHENRKEMAKVLNFMTFCEM